MEIALKEIACCNCGITFWVTQSHNAELIDKKLFFYCPNGHSQSYTSNEKDRLREEIVRKNSEIADLRDQLNRKCLKPRTKKK
jgi:hypothetical protein